MGKPPEYISGIYNYCDRWCERCPFTARCEQFAQSEAAPRSDDSQGDDFWEQLHRDLEHALELAQEAAAEMGVDVDNLDTADTDAALAPLRSAEKEKLAEDAAAYSRSAFEWLESSAEHLENELISRATVALPGTDPEKDAVQIGDAVEVIRWYLHFIRIKLTRALAGAIDERGEDLDGYPSDADGSAKIALIAIDRSIAAWTILRAQLAEDDDTVLDPLAQLARLRRGTEERFPRARSFVRPGFDEATA